MNADEFRDYCLGFIFYKYLFERQHLYANGVLAEDGIDFLELDESSMRAGIFGGDRANPVTTPALATLASKLPKSTGTSFDVIWIILFIMLYLLK